MGLWIPGPEQLCWPANRRRMPPNTPHEAAIADREVEPAPKKRTRRTTKKED